MNEVMAVAWCGSYGRVDRQAVWLSRSRHRFVERLARCNGVVVRRMDEKHGCGRSTNRCEQTIPQLRRAFPAPGRGTEGDSGPDGLTLGHEQRELSTER